MDRWREAAERRYLPGQSGPGATAGTLGPKQRRCWLNSDTPDLEYPASILRAGTGRPAPTGSSTGFEQPDSRLARLANSGGIWFNWFKEGQPLQVGEVGQLRRYLPLNWFPWRDSSIPGQVAQLRRYSPAQRFSRRVGSGVTLNCQGGVFGVGQLRRYLCSTGILVEGPAFPAGEVETPASLRSTGSRGKRRLG